MAGITAMINPLLSLLIGAATLQATNTPAITGPVPLAWRWVQPTNVPPSGMPLVEGRTIYLAVGPRVFALNADSGNELWKFPRMEETRGNFRVSPVKVGDTIVVPSDAGIFFGVDAKDGSLKWQFMTSTLGPGITPFGQPTAAAGLVIAALSDKTLIAIDPQTGQLASSWETPLPLPNGTTGILRSHGDNVILLTQNSEMQSLSAVTRKVNWSTRFGTLDIEAVPIVQGDMVYINSANYLVAINAVTGRGRWQTDIGDQIAFGPAIGPNGILTVTRDGKGMVYGLNGRRTNKEVIDLESLPVTVPTAVGEMFLVPTANGALNLVEPKEGKVVWSFLVRKLTLPTTGTTSVVQAEMVDTRQLYVQAAGPATVSGNTILVLGKDGSLLAFDPEIGVDMTPPEAFMVWPMPGSQISGQPPLEFVFKVDDETTGVKIDSLKIDIDGNPVEFTVGRDLVAVVRFSAMSGNKLLLNGRRTINLQVEDWMGNVTKKSFSLSIDNTLPPLARPGARNRPEPAAPGGRGRAGGGTGRGQ